MKKAIKKIICMILCFAMIFTTLQTTMFSASAKVVGPDNKTELTITTDKSKYSWGDTIVFNIDVKNVSNETLTGIRISSLARNYMKLVEDGDAPVISKLEPGETTTVQVKYFATKLVGVMAFFFPIIWLFSPAARILYRETPFNYEKKVKVGAIKYRIGFEVEYGVEETLELKYDLMGIKVSDYPESQRVVKGNIPEEPEIPYNEDYLFEGWYTSKDFQKNFYFEDELYENSTIYAKWIKISGDSSNLISSSDIYQELNKNISSFSSKTSLYDVTVNYELENGRSDVVISESNDARIARTTGIIGKPIEISLVSEEKVKSAQIVFKYNDKEINTINKEDLGILWYDEKNDKLVLLDSKVDTKNKTVSTTTNHFSKYLLVDTAAWKSAWQHKQLVTRDTGETLRYAVCMCLDTSGSMSGTAVKTCQESAKKFVDQLVCGDAISVVGFNSTATTIVPQTIIDGDASKNQIKSMIKLSAGGGTNFNAALNKALETLSTMSDSSSDYNIYKKYIVLISDGQSSVTASTLSEIVDCGYNVITIGIGSSVSENVLKQISSTTEGSYAFVSDPNDIESVFKQIQGQYIGLSQDTDGDKIADLVETSGMIDIDGYIYHTDPNSVDTDGDGISDSEEMGAYYSDKGCFVINSSPTTPTYKSDKAKISSVDLSITNNTNSTKKEDYMSARVSFKISTVRREYPNMVVDGKTITDYLSETVYENAKNVFVKVKTSTGFDKIYAYNEIKENGTKQGTFNISIDNWKKSNVEISIEVYGDNFDTVKTTKTFNFANNYISYLDRLVNENEKNICKKATQIINMIATEEKLANKEIDEIVALNQLDVYGKPNPEMEKILKIKIADYFKEVAKKYSEKLKNLEKAKIGSDLVKKVFEVTDADEETIVFKIGTVEYKAFLKNFAGGANLGTVEVKASNGETYNYVFSSTNDQAEKAMTDYVLACKAVEKTAVKDCLKEVLNVSGKVLEIDMVKKLLDAKCGKIVDKYLYKNGFNFSYNEMKTAYKYYDTASKAVDNAKKVVENPNEKTINKAMKSVEKLVNFQF